MALNESMFSDEERARLEAIRLREGLETIDQAFEWLTKTAIRTGVMRITGRNRALYAVEGVKKS